MLFFKGEIIKKWMVQSDEGKDIFFFELYYLNNIKECIYFDTNIELQAKHKKIVPLHMALMDATISSDERETIAQALFKMLKQYKSLRKFYYPEECLDKNGRLHIPTYGYVQQKKYKESNLKFDSLKPYSMGYNEDIFLKFKKLFYPMLKEIMLASKEIEKVVFEKELVTNSLDCAYVEVYSRKNKYFVFEDEKDFTYFILKGNTLQLLFEKKKVLL